MRYVFHPGRDVIVGYGSRCDIPLDRLSNPAATSQTTHPELVLRFAGTHWVAIDRSPNGIFVDGARMSTVDIRNGQAITIGDPHRGPRLIFNVGPPVGPPAGPPAGPRPTRADPPVHLKARVIRRPLRLRTLSRRSPISRTSPTSTSRPSGLPSECEYRHPNRPRSSDLSSRSGQGRRRRRPRFGRPHPPSRSQRSPRSRPHQSRSSQRVGD